MSRIACIIGLFIALASSAQALDPKYLPADTEVVITLNVKQLLASELVKSHKGREQIRSGFHASVPGGEEALKHLQHMGFDPLKDLERVTVAMPPSKDPEAAFIAIEGKFDAAKVKATAEAAARDNPKVLKITQAGGQTVYEVTPPDDKKLYIALAGDALMLVTRSKENLTDALGRGTKSPVAKKEVLALLATTTPKQSLSFIATGSALTKLTEDLPVPVANADQALKAITGISGAITVEKDLQFQIGVGMTDAGIATKMAQAANGGLFAIRALVQQQAMENKELEALVDIAKTLKVSAEGTSVILSGEITSELMGKLPALKKYIPIP